jgi:LysM repeat protein
MKTRIWGIVTDGRKVESMYTFTHYKVNHTENGIEVILYMDQNVTEFSSELGQPYQEEKVEIEEEATSFVKRVLPSLKISTVKVVVGAIVLTTVGMSTVSTKSASATMDEIAQQDGIDSTYTVVSGDSLSGIAKRYGTTVEVIKQANNLTSDFLRIGQSLTIPSGTSNSQATTPVLPVSNVYQVVSGDTLSGIAKRNGTTVDAIKQSNNLTSDFLRIGQQLTIPSGTSAVPATNPTLVSSNNYQVISGDTLSGIAKRNGTTVDAIKQANNLTSDFLRIGQQLTIPSGTSAVPTTNPTLVSSNTYQVVSGDTLSGIAKKNGTTVEIIKQANNLTSDFLRIGQSITIPAGATTTVPIQSTTYPQKATVNQEDLMWLAKMIYSESRGESLQGQIAVGAVIMNRVKSPLFPNSVKEVLFQTSNGYYQFTPAQTGSILSATPTSQNMEAALRALNGEDPTDGSLYFYNPTKTSSVWLKSRTVSTTIGNHTFAY